MTPPQRIAAPADSRSPSPCGGGALASGRSLHSLASSLRSRRDPSSRKRSSAHMGGMK